MLQKVIKTGAINDKDELREVVGREVNHQVSQKTLEIRLFLESH